MSLTEIGPRFVLTPIRIFEGAFSGATVYSNPGASPLHTLSIVLLMCRNRVRYPRRGTVSDEAREGREVWQ